MTPSTSIRRRRAGLSLLTLAALAWAWPSHTTPPAAAAWWAELCTAMARPMFSSAAGPAGSNARPATTVQPLSCEPLPNVPGKSLSTVLVSYPPRAHTPAHRHPGSVSAVVVEGTIRSQLGGGPAVDYTVNQTWFEPPGTLHVFAENPDPLIPAKLIATFVTDADCGPLLLPP